MPLSDVRVVEIADGIPAAYCASLFADLGADVIVAGPRSSFRARTDAFAVGLQRRLDRNKAVAELTHTTSDWSTLLRWADLLVVESRPSELARALDGALLPPHLVTVAITRFGDSGPRSAWKGSDLIDAAYGGGCQQNGEPGRPPLRPPALVGDHELGVNAAAAGLTALAAARRDGVGQIVEVAGVDTWATIQTAVGMLEFVFQGRVAMRAGRRFPGRRYPYTVLPCQDGEIHLICLVGREWARSLEMMGDPAWGRDPRYADRQVNQDRYADELDALVGAWLGERSKREVLALALEHQVPWAPVQSLEDVLADVQLEHRGYFWRDDGLAMPGFPARLSRTPAQLRWRAADAPRRAVADLSARPERARSDAAPRHTTPTKRPLEGVRVVDFGWAWAGGLVGSLLADFGADVIKVESKKRLDPMRMDRPLLGPENAIEQGSLHQNVNRNKRSMAVDITDARGVDLVRKLACSSDVLVENLSPGALDRHGLGYDALAADHPGLVYLSLGAVGTSGPLRGIRSYAPVITALAGVDALTGYLGERLLGLQHGLSDPNASLHGAVAVLAALNERERSGRGQHIDLSQLESLVSLLGGHLMASQLGGDVGAPIGNQDHHFAPHGVYRTSGDDSWIAIACESDTSWHALRALMGDPPWAREPRYASESGRLAARVELDAHIETWTKTQERWDLAERAQAAGITAAPLLDTAERFADDHLQSRDLYVGVDHPVMGAELIYGIPWKLGRTPGVVVSAAPLLGQHTDEILRGVLGLDEAAVTGLRDAGVLQ
jgi:crotonobetainyl-CoA:carnitine CoA-transferase CaiB-like acyl-CoA transferase